MAVLFLNEDWAQSAVHLLHITAQKITNSRNIFGKKQFHAKFRAKIISRGDLNKPGNNPSFKNCQP